jgi:protein subunit release factor B
VSVRAAQGGDDAQRFAAMLVRMYERFIALHNLEVIELRREQTAAGVRVWQVRLAAGMNPAIGVLAGEDGVHRVVHEVAGRRQTSFALVEVEALHAPIGLVVTDRELRIDRTRGSGPGGQHRNKVETAVRMTHLPTGLQAWSSKGRSQADNLATARRVLLERIATHAASQTPGKATRAASAGSFGSQRRSYRLHGRTQGVSDHRTGRSCPAAHVLDRARLELLR